MYKQVQEGMQGTYLKARDVGPGLIEKAPIQNRNFIVRYSQEIQDILNKDNPGVEMDI